MRRTVLGAIAIIAMVFSLFSVPISASATSDYDDFINVTPTVSVYTDGDTKSQTMNLTDIWWEEIKQSYERILLHNDPRFSPNFIPKFEEIVANGGSSGIVVENTYAGKLLHVFASNDPNIQCEFTGSSTILDVFWCETAIGYDYVSANYITHASYGGNGCGGNTCSDNEINIYSAPTVVENATFENYVFAAHLGNIHNFEFHYLDFDIEYPPGYEGEIIPTEPPLLEYVAMGDSFSSGEGVEPFLAGTDRSDDPNTPNVNEENRCHRSNYAYPKLLQRDSDFNYHVKFVACSGATTWNITNTGQGGEPRQSDAVSGTTDVVTLTIGGNDMGFKEFATACVIGECDEYSTAYSTAVSNISGLGSSLESTYNTILSKLPTTGKLYVISYPMMVPLDKTHVDPIDFDCHYLYNGTDLGLLGINSWGNNRAVQDVIARLNAAIELAVFNVGTNDNRIEFVDIRSSFEGHDLCSSNSHFLNNYLISGVFHPTTQGIVVIKEEITASMND